MKKEKIIKFIVIISILTFFLILFLNSIYYNKIFPEFFPNERSIQSFPNDFLIQQSMGGFSVLNDGSIISTNYDPQIYLIVNSNKSDNILTIEICKLNVKGASAQVFYIKEGEHFSESNSVRFHLQNGKNIINLPYNYISQIRLDLAEIPDVSMMVKYVSLSNFTNISIKYILTFIIIISCFTLIIYYSFFKKKDIENINELIFKINNNHEITAKYFEINTFYWVCVIITAALCYGFTLANSSLGFDCEISIYDNYPWIVGMGEQRWGYYILSFLPVDFFHFSLYWNNFITVIFYIFTATLWVNIFKNNTNGYFNNTAGVIFTCISISLPYLANGFAFMQTNIANSFSNLLIVICANIFFLLNDEYIKRKIIYFLTLILCIFLLMFCISLYEIALPKFLIGIYSIIFLKFILSSKNDKYLLKKLIYYTFLLFIICFISIILWKFIANILQNITGIKSSGRANVYINFNFESISLFLNSVKETIKGLIKNIFYFNDIYTNNLISFARIITFIIIIILTIIRKKYCIFFTGVILLLTSISLEFLSNNYSFPLRNRYYTANFVGFSFALLYLIIDKIEIKYFKIKYIILIIFIFIILNSSLWMNKIFYEQYLVYQYRKDVMQTINDDLIKFSKNKPIGFIGELPIKKQLDYRIYEMTHYNYSNIYPMMRANLSIHAFFACHGNDLYGFSKNNIIGENKPYNFLYNINIKDYINMKSYPEEGYIFEDDDYIIIKLGEINRNLLN